MTENVLPTAKTDDDLDDLVPFWKRAPVTQCEWIKLTRENADLKARLGTATVALDSYAAFYDQAAAAVGLPGALPSSQTDALILAGLTALRRENAGLKAENKRLKAELQNALIEPRWECED